MASRTPVQPPQFDIPSVKAELARRDLTYRDLREASQLSVFSVTALMNGRHVGKLVRIQAARAMEMLGIPMDEVVVQPNES